MLNKTVKVLYTNCLLSALPESFPFSVGSSVNGSSTIPDRKPVAAVSGNGFGEAEKCRQFVYKTFLLVYLTLFRN